MATNNSVNLKASGIVSYDGAGAFTALANPLIVGNGGTGVTSTTAYAIQCGGTTSTAPLQSIASVGIAAQVLTSNGAGALPTFQAAATGTLTGDTGGALSPTAGNFNLLGGSNGIDVAGAGSTLTFNFDVSEQPAIPISVATESGTATPALNAMSILGGEGIDVSGATSVVTIAGEDASSSNKGIATFDSGDFTVTTGNVVLNGAGVGQTVTADTGGALSPTSGNWNIIGGSNGIDTAGAGSTITLNFDLSEQPTIAAAVVTDSGTATPAVNSMSIVGGTGIDTSGATSVVTVTFDVTEVAAIATSFAGDSGSAVPAVNILTVAGGTGITTSAATSTVTVTLDTPVVVANGGTGLASTTAYAVICGGTTSTAALQSIASVGTSAQVLTSNGAAALPTFQDAGGGGAATILTKFTTSGTWTKAAGTVSVRILIWGSGGGAGSGAKQASGVVAGGGGGGGAGQVADYLFDAADLGATETVTIGAGGAGGTSTSTNSSNGDEGTRGADTKFGDFLLKGGAFGERGQAGSATPGGAAELAVSNALANATGGGTKGGDGQDSGSQENGDSKFFSMGGTGGGGGAWVDTGNNDDRGGNGGNVQDSYGFGILFGGVGGSAGLDGGAGNDGSSLSDYTLGGTGGGAGGSSNSGDAGDGGAGGIPGGGGGAGSGSRNSVGNSGAGGAGARGEIWVFEYL